MSLAQKFGIYSQSGAPYLRYSPWSNSFSGSQGTRVFLQAVLYSAIFLGTSHLISQRSSASPDTEDLNLSYASPEELECAIEQLRQIFPRAQAVVTDPDVLKTYGSSENSYHPALPHSVIVRPQSTADVVQIVNIARNFRVPITPYSGATSLEGHFSGYPTGSICVDLSAMDKILAINVDDSDLICQAGTRWEDINQTLKERGIPLFFPLDPGPGATIGGMVGTGCSGTNAVRYGTARAEWFLNLTVVLPNGEIIKTKRRARKSASGFDTTKLFVGAEGTLGIVTEATLRLAPVLPTRVAMAQFPNVQKAVSAVQDKIGLIRNQHPLSWILAALGAKPIDYVRVLVSDEPNLILNSPYGPHIQCVELLDDNMMATINSAGLVDKPYPVKDTLFFKIQGDDQSIKQASKVVEKIVNNHGSSQFIFAKTEQEAEELWESRKYALMSSIGAHPGKRCWTTDVCVPVSRLPELVYETKKDLNNSKLINTIVGHVGDGNFHSFILFDENTEFDATSGAVHRLVHRAIALDGTCTGEHGVGLGKKEYLEEELGINTVNLMKTIKKAIDPLNIMNPGKLYPNDDRSKK
uniref:D-lactate dehydrogenase (cytochrome) n=1 Tax=Psilocybe cubensis TaxID=181762 RepID=A0A8H7Y5B3_PSICU